MPRGSAISRTISALPASSNWIGGKVFATRLEGDAYARAALGARTLHDHHRGYGGFVLEHQGRKIYHAGDSAYFDGFKEIGSRLTPDVALLPIAYHPESFRRVHMGRTKP